MTPRTTPTGARALVVDDGRLLLVRQRRPYGVHFDSDAKSRPQVEEDRTQSYAVRP